MTAGCALRAFVRGHFGLAVGLCLVMGGGSGCFDTQGGESEGGSANDATSEGAEQVSTCDPLRQDCGAGQACTLNGRVFGCSEVGDSPAGFGEACGPYNEACGPGLACGGEVVPGCGDGFGCCTSYCEVGEDSCPSNMTCVSLFSGSLPPDTADVGVCALGG